MDLNGKKSTQIKPIKDPIHGCSLVNQQIISKFTNLGIYYENDDSQTFVYDFATGKKVKVTGYNMYYLEAYSKNLQKFTAIDYD